MGRRNEGNQVLGCVLSAIIVIALLVWGGISIGGGCGPNYSTGARSGYIYKFSKKGFVMKSWEGELRLSNVPISGDAATGNIWTFSVEDENVAQQVEAAMSEDNRVKLNYRQWMIKPVSQDSKYTVTAIEKVK